MRYVNWAVSYGLVHSVAFRLQMVLYWRLHLRHLSGQGFCRWNHCGIQDTGGLRIRSPLLTR